MLNRNLPMLRKNRFFDPWSSFQDEVKDLFSRFNQDWGEVMPLTSSDHFVPRLEVKDKGSEYRITAELPGIEEKDIDINLEDNVLTLQGERHSESKEEDKERGYYRSEISYGNFYRTIPLDEQVDEDKVQASYQDGMLKIVLPKKEGAMRKAKKISIGGSATKH